MKKLFFTALFVFSFYSFGQTVNGIPISELDAKYIRINSERRLLKPFQVKIYLDYGQIARIKDIKKGFVLDEAGKKFSFNGIMGAVNLLVENGYEVYQVYSGEDDINYLMKRVD